MADRHSGSLEDQSAPDFAWLPFRRWAVGPVDSVLGWGPDDPTKVLDLCPYMLYQRVSGLTWEETISAEFPRVALERLLCSSDSPPLSDT